MKDEFIIWFVEQHGKRPSNKNIVELREEFYAHRSMTNKLEQELIDCEMYDARYQSALYAWNARDK